MKWTERFKSKTDGEIKPLSAESQIEEFHHDIVTGNVLSHRYQCPMKCEGDKTYNQPGNCPVCNMKLAAID
jgi:hypothetical protein